DLGAALMILVAPVTLGACRSCPPRMPPPPTPGDRCISDAECTAPFTCQHPDEPWAREAWINGDDRGFCTRGCRSHADCGAGTCGTSGLCQPPPNPLRAEILGLRMVEHPVPIEVSPWLQGAAGWRLGEGNTRGTGSVGAGL